MSMMYTKVKISWKIFYESLGEHAMKTTYYKTRKKMKLLTKKQQELYENAKSCLFVKKNLKNKYLKIT